MLSVECSAVRVLQVCCEPGKESGSPVLLPCDEPLADVCQQPGSRLEIFSQGGYLGFLSHFVGARFLQMRRAGQHRLAFYSKLFGVFEQWQVSSCYWT